MVSVDPGDIMTVFSWCLADNQVVENVYDKNPSFDEFQDRDYAHWKRVRLAIEHAC